MKISQLAHIAACAASLALFAPGGPAWAQALDFVGGGGQAPVTIDAQGGIEWRQEEQVFIAAGPAKATRNDLVIDADEMRAYYREGQGGKSEAYRLDAIGNVRITTPGRVATGGHAVYDVDKSVIVLRDGRPVKLVSGEDVITTDGQLEFWDARDLAVARSAPATASGALAVRADKQVRAKVLTAYFVQDAAGKNTLDRPEAFDNVRIDTARERAFSDRAAYNVPTGLARLTGSVKIKQGENVINGCSADIDLNTGVSRMNSCDGQPVTGSGASSQAPAAPDEDAGRVTGVLRPRPKE